MKKLLKKIYNRVRGLNRLPPPELAALYAKLGNAPMDERWFYYGHRRRLAHCLNAEAAPGTAELTLLTLDALPHDWKVLDFGCGQAKSETYRKLGFKVAACDILKVDTSDFTLIDPKEQKLPFTTGEFDVCIASEVIEHVESPFVLLDELLRVTKHRLIVTTPNPALLHSRQVFKKRGYLYWFTPADFSYHCSPVFHWQLERFCKERGVTIAATRANHEVFGLGKPWQTHGESLLIIIDKSRAQK